MGLFDYKRLPGLLGDPEWDRMTRPNANLKLTPMSRPPAPQQRQSGGIGGALGSIFGGQNDPRLSAEQNEQARKQAMLMAGLGILGSDASGLKAIAQGGMIGQQAGMQGREGMYQRGQAAEFDKIASGEGDILPQLYEMYKHAATTGNTQMATSLATLIQAREASQRNTAVPKAPVRGSPEWLAAREAELKLERRYRPASTPMPGTPEYTAMLEERARIAAKYRPAPRTAAGSEDERKAASFLRFIPKQVEYVDQFLGAPGRLESAMTDKGLREGTSEEMQKLNLSAIAIGEAWLRMTTGAGYNREEMQNAGYMFVPRPGDKPGTLEMKKQMRADLMNLLKIRGGRALQGESAPEEQPDDTDPFGDL